MGKVRRRFDAKFKTEICQQIAGGTDIREVCRDHQLHSQTVERWVEKFAEGTSLSRPSAREKALEKQVEKLQAKVGEMTMTIDLLKKFNEQVAQRKRENGSVITAKNLEQFQKRVKS